jgi:hypothetical protein
LLIYIPTPRDIIILPASINAKVPPHADAIDDDPIEEKICFIFLTVGNCTISYLLIKIQ